MVEECPDGNEWNAESKLKKLIEKELLSMAWLGLGLPTTCLIIWVKTPVIRVPENKNKKNMLSLLLKILKLPASLFFKNNEINKPTKHKTKIHKESPNTVKFMKNSLEWILSKELLNSLNFLYKLMSIPLKIKIFIRSNTKTNSSIFIFFITPDG